MQRNYNPEIITLMYYQYLYMLSKNNCSLSRIVWCGMTNYFALVNNLHGKQKTCTSKCSITTEWAIIHIIECQTLDGNISSRQLNIDKTMLIYVFFSGN